jgi:hypothetical protein
MIRSEDPYRSVLIHDPIVTHGDAEAGRTARSRASSRTFIGAERLTSHLHRVRGKSAVEKLVLLILDDEQTAAPSVIQKTRVILNQRGIGFVGSTAPND